MLVLRHSVEATKQTMWRHYKNTLLSFPFEHYTQGVFYAKRTIWTTRAIFVDTREFKTPNGDTHRFTMNEGGKTVSYENIHPLGFKQPDGKPATHKYGFGAFPPETARDIYKQLKAGNVKPQLEEKLAKLKQMIEQKFESTRIILDKNGATNLFTSADNGTVKYSQQYELGFVAETSFGRFVAPANQFNLFEKTLPAAQAKNIFEQLAANAYAILTDKGIQMAEPESHATSSLS